MEIMILMETTAAISGLVCLTIALLSAKKQLKDYIRG